MHALQKLREAAGFNITELAEYTGLAEGTIRKIEQGTSEYKTNYGVALILAQTFDCEVLDIFHEDDLSHLGRRPLTGRPITERLELKMEVTTPSGTTTVITVSRTREGFVCPSCQIVMPVTGICDNCN